MAAPDDVMSPAAVKARREQRIAEWHKDPVILAVLRANTLAEHIAVDGGESLYWSEPAVTMVDGKAITGVGYDYPAVKPKQD